LIKSIQILVDPLIYIEETRFQMFLRQQLNLSKEQRLEYYVRKRSIDARGRKVRFALNVDCYLNEKKPEFKPLYLPGHDVSKAKEVHIVGAGPAGLFAAIKLIELGRKPIIIERGKPVKERRRDLANLTKNHIVNPDSNYCFGEGGAGTYSDGKLYTRSNKRGDVDAVLNTFIAFGANPDIAIDARPHIGTNKLPQIIEKMREYILSCGGEIVFNTRLTDILTNFGALHQIKLSGGVKLSCDNLILATGHSADDIYRLLYNRNIKIEAKPFALGARTEHRQEFIDSTQYHCSVRPDYLPPAYYSLVTQVEGAGVYSFCMCPGGIIAPCSTEEGLVVTNGWSPSKRNNPYSNSGIVTEISLQDLSQFDDPETNPLVGLEFRRNIEKTACDLAGGTQQAPAQSIADFIQNKVTKVLPLCSYTPGIKSVDLKEVLPGFVHQRLKKAFIDFDKKIKGWAGEETVAVAVESRTSSPVRIPRNSTNLQHVEIAGLYPCAEGAGYAGGIASAAIDGMRCAEQIALSR
jgi:uncharacterized FAD-dependent dehydrogenase